MATKPYSAGETSRAIRIEVNDLVQETALAALRSVVLATPVGDPTLWQNPESAPPGYVGGHARRNWRVSLTGFGSEIVGTEGRGPGSGGASSEAINDGRGTIERADVRQGAVYIFNNVPYIGRLNAGWSTQAPANFVEKAVQVATRLTDDSRRLVP